ncbi:unnamed protein product [Lathyrus oleraceus]
MELFQRSQLFVESYDTTILEKYGEDSSTHPMIDPKVWAEVSGHKKTRHTFMDHSLEVRRTMSAYFLMSLECLPHFLMSLVIPEP